jgi:co-chaperonin GroES (HSP10)
VIAIPDDVRARALMGEMRGVVVELGAHVWPDEPARAKPGDKVLISKYTGVIVHGTADNKLYRLCNDQDIFCAIEVGGLDSVLIEPAKAREVA